MPALIIERMNLTAVFVLMIYVYVKDDRKGGLHWYPKHVQKAAIDRGLKTAEEIQ